VADIDKNSLTNDNGPLEANGCDIDSV